MDSMRRNPENRTAFERQGTTNGKKILKSQGHPIRPVSVQPMIAHADAKARAHPEEEERDSQCTPTEQEQRGDRPEVEKAEGDAVGPVYFSRVGQVDRVVAHGD